MKKRSLLILSLIVSLTIQAQFRPFPQHVNYAAGTIKPSKYTQKQLDSITFTFYEMWKNKYLRNDCNDGQYYVYFDTKNTLNVSEGLGYGMLITAYMAGIDPLAKFYFDGLYNFYKAHPSAINPYLMAWEQVPGCQNNPNGGNNAATDGDIDIAYGMLLAKAQWGNKCVAQYDQEGINVINAIMKDEINPETYSIKLGDWAQKHEPKFYYATRSSDFIMDHFKVFRNYSTDAKWDSVIDRNYKLIENITTKYAPKTGFMPDFIVDIDKGGRPATRDFLESDNDGSYYYNSCRYPWRISMDYLLYGDQRAKNAMIKINDFLIQNTGGDAWKISSGYKLNGDPVAGGRDYTTPSFIAPFTISAMIDKKYQNWLDASYDALLGQKFEDNGYYENTVKTLALIVISGNSWAPELKDNN